MNLIRINSKLIQNFQNEGVADLEVKLPSKRSNGRGAGGKSLIILGDILRR